MFINFIAYGLIPVYTVLFVENSNWFTTNFSVLGNLAERRTEFVLWGLLVGIYFFWCLRRIVAHMKKQPRGDMAHSPVPGAADLCHHDPLSAGGSSSEIIFAYYLCFSGGSLPYVLSLPDCRYAL